MADSAANRPHFGDHLVPVFLERCGPLPDARAPTDSFVEEDNHTHCHDKICPSR